MPNSLQKPLYITISHSRDRQTDSTDYRQGKLGDVSAGFISQDLTTPRLSINHVTRNFILLTANTFTNT